MADKNWVSNSDTQNAHAYRTHSFFAQEHSLPHSLQDKTSNQP